MGVMSSLQYYGRIWGARAFFAPTTDKDQTGGSLFSLAIMSKYSYATWTDDMHTFQFNTLIQFLTSSVCFEPHQFILRTERNT